MLAVGTANQNIYNSVEEMKQDETLKSGMFAITVGYYEPNDGGGSVYKITNVQDNTKYQENMNNNNFATLITNGQIIPQQFGCKGNGIDDDSEKMQQCLNYASINKTSVQLKNKYLISNKIILNSNLPLIINGSQPQIGQTISGNNSSFSNFIFGSYGNIEITGTTNVTFQNVGFNGTNKCIIIKSFRNKIINCSFNGFDNAISMESGTNWVGENQILNSTFNTVTTCVLLNSGSDSDICGNLVDKTCDNFITGGNDAGFKIENNHDYSKYGSALNGYNVTFVGNYIDGWNKLTITGNSGFNITGNTFLGQTPTNGVNKAIKFTASSISSGCVCGNNMTNSANNLTNDYLYFIDIEDVTYFSYVTVSGNNTVIAKKIFYGGNSTKLWNSLIEDATQLSINVTNDKVTLTSSQSSFSNNIATVHIKANLDNITNKECFRLSNVCSAWLYIIKMNNSTSETNVYLSDTNIIEAKGSWSTATSIEVWAIGIKKPARIPSLF